MKLIIVSLLIVLLALALSIMVVEAQGYGREYRSDACHTYHTFSHQKNEELQEEQDGVFCGTNQVLQDKNNAAASVIVTVSSADTTEAEIIPTIDPTATPPNDNPSQNDDNEEDDRDNEEGKDKKKHCNNGEGNGSEGCNATDNPRANNDENDTRPNEDRHNNR